MTIDAPKPEPSEADSFRRAGFVAWFARREASGYTRANLMAETKLSKGRVSQLFDQSEKFGEGAARRIENAIDDLHEGFFLELGRSLSSTKREISTAEIVGMPRKDGQTTTVKLTTEYVKDGSIDQLPLLPWGMIERIGMSNNEIQGLAMIELGFGRNAWDPSRDKVIQAPDTSLAPRIEMGDFLIMHPLSEGEAFEAGRLPVLVRLPDGTHALTPYNALQISLNKLVVVAVCRQFFSPPTY